MASTFKRIAQVAVHAVLLAIKHQLLPSPKLPSIGNTMRLKLQVRGFYCNNHSIRSVCRQSFWTKVTWKRERGFSSLAGV